MEPVRFDLKEIVNEFSDEEKEKYFIESSSKYFKYLYETPIFKKILYKLDNDYIIKEEEWMFLFKRFFAVTCKAIEENEKISFLDKVIYMFSKIGFHIGKLDSKFYNECYKMREYINSIKMNADINNDLLLGLEKVGSGRDYKNLETLLNQHIVASSYREYKDLFYESYKKSENSIVSYDERIAINSLGRYYTREKELVKNYK